MKRILKIVVEILLLGIAGFAMAQSKTPTPGKSASVGVLSGSIGSPQANPTHNLNFRLRQDMMQINKDVHSGKLTQAQATTLRTQILAVRKQELADMKSNGNKQLTSDQEAQLGQSLGQIESQL